MKEITAINGKPISDATKKVLDELNANRVVFISVEKSKDSFAMLQEIHNISLVSSFIFLYWSRMGWREADFEEHNIKAGEYLLVERKQAISF